jgi:hypothetical protein
MRRDYRSCERDVGQILAVCVELGIRRIGGAGESELLSAGARRPGPGR